MASRNQNILLVVYALLLYVLLNKARVMELVTSYAPPVLQPDTAFLVKAASILILCGAMARALLSLSQKKDVYLIEYACFRPPDIWRISNAAYLEHGILNGIVNTGVEFQRKILQHSGIGPQTYLPPSFHYIPAQKGMEFSRAEAQSTFFTVLDDLFLKTSIKPSDIGILILNCCLFYPSPSLSSMIVNRYKMRVDVKSFNLSGMGCAASLLAVDMARHLLQVHRETYALILSSENMSGKDYQGARRSMMIANCLFRSGGAAALVSNRPSDRKRAKYRLLHTVRTITAAEDRSYFCITHGEDETGQIGVSLSKELTSVAGDALTKNITILARDVLPLSEKLYYATNLLARKIFHANWKPYMPDFKRAFSHFCIHAGGKAVIQELEQNLKLTKELTEASRMTLHRFGNTSSTSVWYELAYLEATQKVKKGDRVWQVALGSGFKCFSGVWESLWDAKCLSHNPWRDTMLKYPVVIPDSVEI